MSCYSVCFAGAIVASPAENTKLGDLSRGFGGAALLANTSEPKGCGARRGSGLATVYLGDGLHPIDKAAVAALCGPGGLGCAWVMATNVPPCAQRMCLLGRP